MAEPEVQIDPTAEDMPEADIEMGEDGEAGGGADDGLGDIEPELPQRTTFLEYGNSTAKPTPGLAHALSYLCSPIVELNVGSGDDRTTLHAHEALLLKSPWFAEQISQFAPGNRGIDLANEDVDATGSVLEWLYNGEYFPRRTSLSKDSALESDPTLPAPDDSGVGLLRHARIYTLASKFQLPALRSLAHSKIHRTASTAKGEIAYARYVYNYTSSEDRTIRGPVAAFWATRSHVLRHEAEDEFRAMCLEFPQFAFDVLSKVLDQKEQHPKQKGASVEPAPGASPTVHAGRKRARMSHG